MGAGIALLLITIIFAASLVNAADLYTNPTTGSDANGCLSATPCRTLKRAITVAIASGQNTTINMANGVYSNATHDVGITLGSESVAITLLGTRSAVIDCANANFAFTVTGGALIGSAFSMTGITIRRCTTALRLTGTEATGTFSGVLFTQSTATAVTVSPDSAGGTILPKFLNCDFTNNVGANGGAVYVYAPTGLPIPIPTNLWLIGCTFTNNRATGLGGALYIETATDRTNTRLSSLTFTGNTAAFNGGSVWIDRPLALGTSAGFDFDNWVVTQSAVTAYAGTVPAGAVVFYLVPTRTVNAIVVRNNTLQLSAVSNVGGLVSVGSNLSFSNAEFSDNKLNATGFAEALLLSAGSVSLNNVTITRNSNGVTGAGLMLTNGVAGSLSWSAITSNSAIQASGVYMSSVSTFPFTSVSITDNYATSLGAGVYITASSALSCSTCVFTNNNVATPVSTADGFGGAVSVTGTSSASFSGGSFSFNTAYFGAAISIASGCSALIDGVTLMDNTGSIGGAVFIGSVPNAPAGVLATLGVRASLFDGNYALTGGAIYAGAIVQASINNTQFVNNSAFGSPISTAGAINFVGTAATATQTVLRLSGVLFDQNDSLQGAHLSVTSVSTSFTNSNFGAPGSGLPCCDTRCIVCDSPSLFVATGGNITCPDAACPTTPAPTTTPPPPTNSTQPPPTSPVPPPSNTTQPPPPPPDTTAAPVATTPAPKKKEKKIIGLKPLVFYIIVGVLAGVVLLLLVVSTILGMRKKKDADGSGARKGRAPKPQSRRSQNFATVEL